MAAHNEFGKAGEQIAVDWLAERGFHMISRNWKSGCYEMDITASGEGVLHFIEVKSRHDDFFGKPEDWVGCKKGKLKLSGRGGVSGKISGLGADTI